MKNKLSSQLLKAPAYLLVIAAFIASIYAAVKGIQGINWGTPVILGLIIVAYIIGLWLERKK